MNITTEERSKKHQEVLLTKKEAGKKVGVHPESIARLSREGRFPRPVRLGPTMHHGVRWLQSEVDAWISQKVAERDVLFETKGNA